MCEKEFTYEEVNWDCDGGVRFIAVVDGRRVICRITEAEMIEKCGFRKGGFVTADERDVEIHRCRPRIEEVMRETIMNRASNEEADEE